jgi:hypothetical protein
LKIHVFGVGVQVGWPDMVTKEVSESLQNFVSHIQIAQGEWGSP